VMTVARQGEIQSAVHDGWVTPEICRRSEGTATLSQLADDSFIIQADVEKEQQPPER